MAQLTNNTIASTYLGLLSVTDAIGTDTLESVTDGAGTSTSLSLSQQRARVTLGTGTDDDFTIYDGSNDILKVEGDTKDVTLLDDLIFISDSAVVKFGVDGDTTLTHTDGTGLTLNSTNKLCFNDASQFVQGSSATVLSIGATNEIDLTATTVDINANADVSGTLTVGGTLTVNAAAVFNEGPGDYDFRVESGSGTHAIFLDAGTPELVINDDQIDMNFRIESHTSTHTFFVDAGADKVGIGTASPDARLEVVGSFAANGPASTFVTMASGDTSPAVSGGNIFKTHSDGVTIDQFDLGVCGQIITIISGGATVYDVTSSELKGGTTNITTAAGDVTMWVCESATVWHLISWMDLSIDLSSGGF